MTSRYPLRNPPSGRLSVRRLSPTAIRNTGPLQRPKALQGTGNASTGNADPGSQSENPASTNHAAMYPGPEADAPEPEASEDVAARGDENMDSSLTSSESDGDDHQDHSTLPVVDSAIDKMGLENQDVLTHVPDIEESESANLPLEDVLIEARRNLTEKQRIHVDRRMENVHFMPNTTQSGEPSQPKGKGVDPGNWGDIQFDDVEIDPQIQQEMIEDCNLHRELPDNQAYQSELLEYLRDRKTLARKLDRHQKKQASAHRKKKDHAGSLPLSGKLEDLIRKVAKGSSKKSKYKSTNGKAKNKSDLLNSTKPITQVTRESALSRALERLSKKRKQPSEDSSSSSSDDESEPDSSGSSYDSESESSESGYNSSSSGNGRQRGARHHHRSSRRHSHRRMRTLIKPTPPEKYGGQVDLRAFHKFLTHGTAYVKYGYVERRRQVMVLSEFLTGKAYTFYTQRVSLNPEKWSLQKFFTELFNYCFPIDFHNQQRTKLNNFTQGNRSVQDYVADLDELFTIVGADSKRAKVVKLFNGFRAPL
ncbi:hypothetical protein C0993_010397 [Termitomyces sp. T159_Od127]|nr:hypothetical protein C0993_010397 [Termitomyces sp. T159_Od127]